MRLSAAVICLLILPFSSAQDVSIGSVVLHGFQGCTEKHKQIIGKAWDDAIKIAKAAKNIKWEEAPAIDYLGPPAYNHKQRDKIQSKAPSIYTILSLGNSLT